MNLVPHFIHIQHVTTRDEYSRRRERTTLFLNKNTHISTIHDKIPPISGTIIRRSYSSIQYSAFFAVHFWTHLILVLSRDICSYIVSRSARERSCPIPLSSQAEAPAAIVTVLKKLLYAQFSVIRIKSAEDYCKVLICSLNRSATHSF